MNDEFIPGDLFSVAFAYRDADEQTKARIRRILGVGNVIECPVSSFIGADDQGKDHE